MLRYSIDHICVKEGQIFSYGWCFCEGKSISKVCFHFTDQQGNHREVNVDYGRQRDDVKNSFESVVEAENAGFLLLAGFQSDNLEYGFFRWYFNSGDFADTEVRLQDVQQQIQSSTKLSAIKAIFTRSFFLIKDSGFRKFYTKAKKYFSKRPKNMSKGDWTIIKNSLKKKRIAVVFDHDMGGGANIYRDGYIKETCFSGLTVVMLSFHVATLQYFIEIVGDEKSTRYSIASPATLISVLSYSKIEVLLYNCAVTFRNPLDIIYVLLHLKSTYQSKIIVAIHDYFVVCPSHFLLNHVNAFCDIPSISECNKCLLEHKDGFVSLAGVRDISYWRGEWAKLLSVADDVVLFSKSSERLLAAAYPQLPRQNWRINPHKMKSDIPLVDLESGSELHIGVIGAIGKHKGAEIVKDLVSAINNARSQVKITVIGTIEAKVDRNVVTVTGPYEINELGQLIASSGINIILFPSICPETFSYVSNEVIAMGLPYACFNLGAPADLARSYIKGKVLLSYDSNYILEELSAFRKKIYDLNIE